MHLVHNERVKLTAAWLNTVGAGTVIAGGVTPIVAMAYGLRTNDADISTGFIMALTFAWLAAGTALHILGRRMMRRLRE